MSLILPTIHSLRDESYFQFGNILQGLSISELVIKKIILYVLLFLSILFSTVLRKILVFKKWRNFQFQLFLKYNSLNHVNLKK